MELQQEEVAGLFYPTQLGRCGSLGERVRHHARPDFKAAHLIAADGNLNPSPRPTLAEIMVELGFCAVDDRHWTAYRAEFDALVRSYVESGGGLLQSVCTRRIAGVIDGVCVHELVPPIQHWTLRPFLGSRTACAHVCSTVFTTYSAHLRPDLLHDDFRCLGR